MGDRRTPFYRAACVFTVGSCPQLLIVILTLSKDSAVFAIETMASSLLKFRFRGKFTADSVFVIIRIENAADDRNLISRVIRLENCFL